MNWTQSSLLCLPSHYVAILKLQNKTNTKYRILEHLLLYKSSFIYWCVHVHQWTEGNSDCYQCEKSLVFLTVGVDQTNDLMFFKPFQICFSKNVLSEQRGGPFLSSQHPTHTHTHTYSMLLWKHRHVINTEKRDASNAWEECWCTTLTVNTLFLFHKNRCQRGKKNILSSDLTLSQISTVNGASAGKEFFSSLPRCVFFLVAMTSNIVRNAVSWPPSAHPCITSQRLLSSSCHPLFQTLWTVLKIYIYIY